MEFLPWHNCQNMSVYLCYLVFQRVTYFIYLVFFFFGEDWITGLKHVKYGFYFYCSFEGNLFDEVTWVQTSIMHINCSSPFTRKKRLYCWPTDCTFDEDYIILWLHSSLVCTSETTMFSAKHFSGYTLPLSSINCTIPYF